MGFERRTHAKAKNEKGGIRREIITDDGLDAGRKSSQTSPPFKSKSEK
jgi:hypothetical protein